MGLECRPEGQLPAVGMCHLAPHWTPCMALAPQPLPRRHPSPASVNVHSRLWELGKWSVALHQSYSLDTTLTLWHTEVTLIYEERPGGDKGRHPKSINFQEG